MKVKRKVAALLALAMVVTGQPSGVLADGLNTLGTSYAAENSDAATGSEAADPTEPEKPELPEEELPEESTGEAEEPSKPEEETPTEEVTEEETEEMTEEETEEPRVRGERRKEGLEKGLLLYKHADDRAAVRHERVARERLPDIALVLAHRDDVVALFAQRAVIS